MSKQESELLSAVESYFVDLRLIRASGGATGERSYYTPLSNLLNYIGSTLKPKVFCVGELADQGAGHPDLGLYSAPRLKGMKPSLGQIPDCGVVEVKPAADDAWLTAQSDQVSRYWGRYQLVLVTNTRDFVLLGENMKSNPVKLETYRLAGSIEEFEFLLEHPRSFARKVGVGLGEYLARALSHRAEIVEPRELAGLLASYARDGLARVKASDDASPLWAVRSALEDGLGVRFQGERGAEFFRSTLVQTLFYGVFSAWVLWSRQSPSPADSFNWHEAVWHLRAPVLRALFQQLSDPGRLKPLGLVELLDWAAAALGRVDRVAFFSRFSSGEAVPYFYEPFLEAFDPELRKQLGVWYTPVEVVRYMVARVDRALKRELGLAEGLASENVYILDPCCGTGAYLAEVLRRIAANLQGRGLGALVGPKVKQAAIERVFGFEIMPAPFVVSHLQVDITLQALDATLTENLDERASVFLTNGLTGWQPTVPKPLLFPELEEERGRAKQVKQDSPVLVVVGNPPYNGYAGMAVEEERELTDAYRTTKRVRPPEGRGLNDLYVRFFRMAERRIVEKSGRGVVCFISNYSWLDGLSFTGMRERYLEVFDEIHIDNLNGDRFKTGKTTPDGEPDPSIFSTPEDPVGIQVGTAITTLIRKEVHKPVDKIGFRNLWGQSKLEELTTTREAEPEKIYDSIEPSLPLGLPFAPLEARGDWNNWPSLKDLFPTSFPGVKTSRDAFLVDTDFNRLKARVLDYFNPGVSHERVERTYPAVMNTTASFHPRSVRETLLAREGPDESGFIRYAYRPFDSRWLYWEADSDLLDRPRSDYKPHVFEGNLWLVSQKKPRREWSPPQIITHLGCLDLMDRGATCIPAWLSNEGLIAGLADGMKPQPNLSLTAQRYLQCMGMGMSDLIYYVIAVLHTPSYHEANRGALRMGWPRIPLPGWPDGEKIGAAEEIARTAERGRELAELLDYDNHVSGITKGKLFPEIAAIAVPSTTCGGSMAGVDFEITAGWGNYQGDAVMPGQGIVVERPNTAEEITQMGDAVRTLENVTFDIYLNERAYWRNVPAPVWNYKIGGYQVLKKWLSYREQKILGRAAVLKEVQHFTDTARRIAAILMLTSGH